MEQRRHLSPVPSERGKAEGRVAAQRNKRARRSSEAGAEGRAQDKTATMRGCAARKRLRPVARDRLILHASLHLGRRLMSHVHLIPCRMCRVPEAVTHDACEVPLQTALLLHTIVYMHFSLLCPFLKENCKRAPACTHALSSVNPAGKPGLVSSQFSCHLAPPNASTDAGPPLGVPPPTIARRRVGARLSASGSAGGL